jgi:protein-tyrosine-phosphatase
MNILALCTRNAARSILLEALLNAEGGGRIRAFSAGSEPAGAVHPLALAALAEAGLPTDGLRSKAWDEFAAPGAPVMDAVITVCDAAAATPCPYWPGAPVRAHWGLPDPEALPEAERPAAFAAALAALRARVLDFLAALPENPDRAALAAALHRDGRWGSSSGS